MQSPSSPRENQKEILLDPGCYVFLQKEGNGEFTIHVGPGSVNATQQDVPKFYDPENRKYKPTSLENAVRQFPEAVEGDYIILENPTEDGAFPITQKQQNAKDLRMGSRVVIPGPWTNALFPGQNATVVPGHRLRTNQYLICTIYNEAEAKENWSSAIVEPATETSGDGVEKKPQRTIRRGLPEPESFAVGTRIVIKGTDVSFYIPPTGVEVVKDKDIKDEGKEKNPYVREAVTLEQLEYCCLIDESGKKEYPRGPDVVFPSATQVFYSDSRKRRKFQPLELNTINGVHLKVTADFTGPDLNTKPGKDGDVSNRNYKEGEELFVTGTTVSIYYPREELTIIEYGRGTRKHFSTMIPEGEGRYVVDRETGDIELVEGPEMLLPNPMKEILVRRVLPDADCTLMYPGNEEALAYNRQLADTMEESPSGRSGIVSEGDYKKSRAKKQKSRGAGLAGAGLIGAAFASPDDFEPEEVGNFSQETITRSTTYTEPRRITLNTKFDGVPKIDLWPGYAVLVVGANGSRRVEVGPKRFLLKYAENLGHLSLSTGKPKTTDNLLRTGYLCIKQNQVADVVPFESKDHVSGMIKLSLRVDFEGENPDDRLKWFSVENYVKLLCDHVRSIISGMAKRHSIAEIKEKYVDLVREAILGTKPSTSSPKSVDLTATTKRPGLPFPDNGMRVVEAEVLAIDLENKEINSLLDQAQHDVVRADIKLNQARKDLEATRQEAKISRETMELQQETERIRMDIEAKKIGFQLEVQKAKFASDLEIENKKLGVVEAVNEITAFTHDKDLERTKTDAEQEREIKEALQKLDIVKLGAETEAQAKRFQAAKDGLAEVMVAMHSEDMTAKLAAASNFERFISGKDANGLIQGLVQEFPILRALFDRGQEASNRLAEGRGNHNRLTVGATDE